MSWLRKQSKELFVEYKFMWIAIALLWMKTYLLYKTGFDIKSQTVLQEFLLFVNPLSSAILFIGITVFFRKRNRQKVVLVLSSLATLVLYGNLLFYRFFADFLTLPVLFQTSNVKDLGGSVLGLLHGYDILLLTDIVILVLLYAKRSMPEMKPISYERIGIVALAGAVFFANLTIAQLERPQLLTRSFDRELLVKNIGLFNYHLYDAMLQSRSKTQRVFADSSDIVEVLNYTRAHNRPADEELFGIAKDKNVVLISLESTQSFVINRTVNGQEITPFLNQLVNDSYYFENFYHQTEQGKTSDSEFLVDNSIFGRESGAVFFTHASNEYRALPEILGESGYYTSVMHANNKSFWNRDLMYPALGYQKFFDIDSYDVNDENSIGWGLKDIDFFKQSVELLKSQPKPYYTKLITLTNHFPFELLPEDKLIEEPETSSRTLNRYITTVRYLDEALRIFFEELEAAGLYEDTVFILYGDHYGISELHNNAMAELLGKEEITPLDQVELQKVPLFIHIPGHGDHQIQTTIAGQIDLKPTILHLLGMNETKAVQFGSDLFSPKRDSFVVFRNGGFVTEELVFTKGTYYRKDTGEAVEVDAETDPYYKRSQYDLFYSDMLINGDLLRFYNDRGL